VRLNHFRTGRGEPLVLIHGIGSQWQMWWPVLGRLQPERELIAIDLPGFAASPMPPAGTPAGMASLTSLVAGFIDELGLERPHVAGNSLGGWISLELAKQGKVRSATLLSPAGFHTSAEEVYQRATLKLAVASARRLAPRAEAVLATSLGKTIMLGQFFGKPQQVPSSDAAQGVRALAGAEWFDATLDAVLHDRFSGGEQIQVPVTIGWGAKDRLLLPRQAPRARREVPGSKLVMLEGCGHVPTWDDPDRVARVLLAGSQS
jgi:pimeloyl-ACP methyl ester carboxylesterase